MAVSDNYWESPYYPGGSLVYAGPGTDDSYGATKHAGRKHKFSPYASKSTPGAGLKNLFNKTWSKSSGIKPYGLGKASNVMGLGYQLYNAGTGLKDWSKSKENTDNIASDIITASYNNPMLQYDLAPDQLKTLRKLRRGNFDDRADFGDVDILGALGGAVKSGIPGLIFGGVPGAIIGALGGGANSIIDDLNSSQDATTEELEALYDAIIQSEQQYNALKKQQMLQNIVM